LLNQKQSTADHLAAQAKAILRENDRGTYTVPTNSGLYPAQWNWDSCLVALGFAQYDLGRAWAEMESLLGGQWSNGMLPSILFHEDDSSYFPNSTVWKAGDSVRSSGITQPPVAAIAVRYLYERTAGRERTERLRTLAPRLLKAHRWLYAARDPDGTGLVSIVHPWESGMDNSPLWDEALAVIPARPQSAHQRRDTGFVSQSMRPSNTEYDKYIALVELFRETHYEPAQIWRSSPLLVADVGFNAILMRANSDLAFLLAEMGDTAGLQEIEGLQQRALAALEGRWSDDDGIYYSLDLRKNAAVRKAGVGCFLPLFARNLLVDRRVALSTRLERWLSAVRYGVPSYEPGEPDFDPRRYWRGPVWLVLNWMLIDGLIRNGCRDLADVVKRHSLELVAQGGFSEYFDPLTGEPLGGRHFSWTAAMSLLLQSL
jgi:hypothetical protein